MQALSFATDAAIAKDKVTHRCDRGKAQARCLSYCRCCQDPTEELAQTLHWIWFLAKRGKKSFRNMGLENLSMLLQVDVEKELVSRGRSFKLKVAFSSEEQFVVLFGPSGSGKTLTLESVAGLVTPDAGRISVNGRVLFDSAGPESMFHPATAG